jgi:exodeoxyribonuclease-3
MEKSTSQQGAKAKILCLVSWNVNGIRAVYRKGFVPWLSRFAPAILCLQEIRARESELANDLLRPLGYYAYWNSGAVAGYGGTALLSREEPLSVEFGVGDEKLDREGRVIIAHYPAFVLANCYFPNGSRSPDRLFIKLEFCQALLAKCEELRGKGKAVIFGGDLNTAHREIDLEHPGANRGKSGFLAEERNWIDKVIESGYVDSFRHFNPQLARQYTWWAYTNRARERNTGWRFDYFFVAEELMQRIADAFIMPEVRTSDHCPVGLRVRAERSGE